MLFVKELWTLVRFSRIQSTCGISCKALSIRETYCYDNVFYMIKIKIILK